MSEYICHFCAKHQDEVALMIAGPVKNSGICDKCVQDCMDIIFSRARSQNLVGLPGVDFSSKNQDEQP